VQGKRKKGRKANQMIGSQQKIGTNELLDYSPVEFTHIQMIFEVY